MNSTARKSRQGTPKVLEQLKVFISYSRQDTDFVDRLQAVLSERNITAHVDREDIEKGEEWWTRIQQLIIDADTIVFVLSPGSITSSVCQQEVDFAKSLNKRFVPIVARDLIGSAVPDTLARLNYIFFYDNQSIGAPDVFETAVNQLVRALEIDIAWIREHTRLGALGQRWEARGRSREMVLRGVELSAAETWLTTRPQNAPDPTDAHRAFITDSRRAATRRQRTTVGLSLAAVVVALGLAGLAFWQRNEAVEAQAVTKQQRDEALKTQSLFLTDLSQRELNLGHSLTATLLAAEALPNGGAIEERPYVAEAEVQLARSLNNMRVDYILRDHKGHVATVAIDQYDKLIASGGEDGIARIWDLKSGKLFVKLKRSIGEIRTLIFVPNSDTLVIISSNNTLSVWPYTKSDMPIRVIDTQQRTVLGMKYTPDGKRLISWDLYGTIVLWDGNTFEPIWKKKENVSAIDDINFDSNGDRFVSISRDHRLEIRATDDGQSLRVIRPSVGSMTAGDTVKFSEDNTYIVGAGFGYAWIISSGDGKTLLQFSEKVAFNYSSILFNASKSQAVVGRSDGVVEFWDVAAKKQLSEVRAHTGSIRSLISQPGGRHFLSVSEDNRLKLWRWNERRVFAEFSGHDDLAAGYEFSKDGSHLITGSWDGTVRVWRATEGNRDKVFTAPDARVYGAEITPDMSRVLIHTGNQGPGNWEDKSRDSLRLWDPTTESEVAQLKKSSRTMSMGTIVDRGRLIISQDDVGEIDLWSSKDGTPYIVAGLSGMRSTGVSKDPTGRYVIVSANEKHQIWDMQTRKLIAPFVHYVRKDSQLLIDSSGSFAYYVDSEKSEIVVIDGESGKTIKLLSPRGFTPTAIAINSSHKILIAGLMQPNEPSCPCFAGIWSIMDGTIVGLLKEHQEPIWTVGFSPDGRWAATGSWDNRVKI